MTGKNYLAAFILGFVMTCVGVILVYIYGWKMRPSKAGTTAVAADELLVNA